MTKCDGDLENRWSSNPEDANSDWSRISESPLASLVFPLRSFRSTFGRQKEQLSIIDPQVDQFHHHHVQSSPYIPINPDCPFPRINMIRSALFHSVRCASRSSSISPARRVAPCLSASLKPSVAPSNRLGTRYYAAAAGLQEEEVQGRIMDLLKNFDKVCMRSRDLQHSLRTDGHLLIGQGHYQGESCS